MERFFALVWRWAGLWVLAQGGPLGLKSDPEEHALPNLGGTWDPDG